MSQRDNFSHFRRNPDLENISANIRTQHLDDQINAIQLQLEMTDDPLKQYRLEQLLQDKLAEKNAIKNIKED